MTDDRDAREPGGANGVAAPRRAAVDPSFAAPRAELAAALELLLGAERRPFDAAAVPHELPETGVGERETLQRLAGWVIDGARDLGAPEAFAHMNPPTPWITWATTFWNAALNQNLLHADTGPAAAEVERTVVRWLAPFFGMDGGHLAPGSTLANLTALWAARETRGVCRVVASAAAHVSVRKAANLLGLEHVEVEPRADGTLDAAALPRELGDSCLVLTAGTTSLGAVDPLDLGVRPAWLHVDAAWGGPLRLSPTYAPRLDGVERADSVSVSAHKLLFQPKESALVLFKHAADAHGALSFEADYLGKPNVGLQGSHGAVAVPLLATLLAWGREGLAQRVERCMTSAEALAQWLAERPDVELHARPRTGIVVWRARRLDAETIAARLPPGAASLLTIRGDRWLRHVAANPLADVRALTDEIGSALAAR